MQMPPAGGTKTVVCIRTDAQSIKISLASSCVLDTFSKNTASFDLNFISHITTPLLQLSRSSWRIRAKPENILAISKNPSKCRLVAD